MRQLTFSLPLHRGKYLVQWSLCLCCLLLLTACKMPFGTGELMPKGTEQGPQLVLALPASGPFASVAAKVRRGAELSQKELKANGVPVRLVVINTEAPDWLKKLQALPADSVVVGGPLRGSRYKQARDAGALEKKVFFTFMPSLEAGDEGLRAWRFFPSAQDQVDAVVRFTADDLGIRSMGALYPNDNYGTGMTALLEKTLSQKGMALQKAAYDKKNRAGWTDAAASLIRPTVDDVNGIMVPNTAFEAIFLPDSWKNMEALNAALLANGEDRLVMLGTNLWEQNVSGRGQADAEKYALAVFPAAWNSFMAPQSLQKAGNDFWVALGYDFVRYGVNLGITERLPSPQVTARAGRAAGMVTAMAPIHWDGSGVAHQKLFMCQASATGMTPVDRSAFRDLRAAVKERAKLRAEGLPMVDAQGNALVPHLPMPGGQQVQSLDPAGQPLSNRPQPSYKLRLPSQR